MRTLIRFTAVAAFLLAGFRVADAGNMFVLGDLLSGNSESSADGAFNPFLIYETDFVGMVSSSKGFYNSTGNGVTNGDSFVGVNTFGGSLGSLANSITDATGAPVGAGFGALIFAGEVTDVSNSDFNLQTLAGGVSAALGNPASGASSNFLSLVVSETFDFASASLSDIGTAVDNGTALEVASFDISSTNQLGSHAFNGKGFTGSPTFQQTTFESNTSLSLDVVSSVAGIEFWTIDRDFSGSSPLYDVEASASYPFGSFGSELYLNILDMKIGVDIDINGNNGQNFITSGNAIAAMNPVPEPSMFAIMGCMGVAGVVARRRKQRKAA